MSENTEKTIAPEEKSGFSAYDRKVHRWGRISMFLALAAMYLPVIGICLRYGVGINWAGVGAGVLAVWAAFGMNQIIEPFTFAPMLGAGGTYSNHQNWRHTAGRGAFSAAEAPKTQEALMAFKFLGQRQLGKLPSRWVSTILMVAIHRLYHRQRQPNQDPLRGQLPGDHGGGDGNQGGGHCGHPGGGHL